MSVLKTLIVIACGLSILSGCSNNEADANIADKTEQYQKKRLLYKKFFLSEARFTPEEKQELSLIHSNVLQAIQSRSVEDVRRNVFVLTNRFHDLPKWSPLNERELEQIFYSSDFVSGQLIEFTSEREFDAHLDLYSNVAVILENLRLRSHGYGYEAAAVEGLVFRKLKQYLEHHGEANERSYGQIAEKHLSRWIDFIESSEGVTRRAAHRLLEYERERIEKIGDTTWTNAMRAVRSLAQGFVNCGYTPRWLDVEFPLPTLDETTNK